MAMATIAKKTIKQTIIRMNELKDYITVAQYAKYLGKTTAHVYQQINAGLIPVVTFQRGKMNGRLIEKPADYDEWYNKKHKK